MKRFFILTLLSCFFLLSQNALAQNNGYIVKKADKYYNDFNFSSALEWYIKADSKQPDNIYLQGRIGNCYKFLSNIKAAEKWYGAVVNKDGSDNIFKFYYAQSLMANGKYREALKVHNAYYESIGKPEKVVAKFQEKLFTENDKYKVEVESFNSEFSDFSALRIKDNLYFVSNRQSDVFMQREDVWSSRPFTQIFNLDLADSTKAKKEPQVYNRSLSKQFHEGPMSWDRSKNDMYITRSNYSGKKPIFGENREVNLKIFKLAYVSGSDDFGSKLVDNVSFDSDNYSVCYPSVSADGNFMVFASDMPGGFGGLDLYVAENAGGIWSNPLNLGEKINTPGNDAFPFIMPDGMLFFASDGHLGLGGYDVYSSELQDDGTFGNVKNLRSPINSSFDDFSYTIDDSYFKGYFTSNRPSEYGGDDIYSFQKKAFMFEALIYDSNTEQILDSAKVTLINLSTKEKIITYTDNEGKVSNKIDPFSNYSLKIEKSGYLPEEANFSTIDDEVNAEIPLVKDFGIVLEVTVIDAKTKEEIPAAKIELIQLLSANKETNTANAYGKTIFMLDEEIEYRVKASKKTSGDEVYLAVSNDFNTFDVESPANLYTTIELRKVNKKQEIRVENIYYDVGKYLIRKDAEPELNKLIKTLNDNPGMEIELSSHTDCRGSKKSNASLSANRAEAAVNYLIKNGINYRRLTATGYGETKLTNNCACEGAVKSSCTEDEHQKNRRTVFSILKFD